MRRNGFNKNLALSVFFIALLIFCKLGEYKFAIKKK